MSETILIRGGRVIDPATGRDGIYNLLLRDGKVAGCSRTIPYSADRVIDAAGCYVMPGLIDLHVHLRDPGQTQKEDIASGTRAAARGGVTTVVAMPNTTPVIDRPERVEYVKEQAQKNAVVHVLQTGSATMDEKGEELSDIAGMVKSGIPAITEDGRSVMNAWLCREALRVCAKEHIPFLDHCEDMSLRHGGCVNEDEYSRAEGLPGIGNDTEDVIIARDLMLAHEVGAHLHLCHCSTQGSFEMLRAAKKAGYDASGEVCPHHFTLCSKDRVPGDTNYKMNPPLRTQRDRDALLQGLATDVFEVISTDHAPHTAQDKNKPMAQAAFGITGLETSVPLVISELVRPGIISPMQMAEKMSTNPAGILHLNDRGSLAEGRLADVTIIDPNIKYRIDVRTHVSKGRNTPFNGREVYGRVRWTICGGKVVFEDQK
jgi:dihydroorotase